MFRDEISGSFVGLVSYRALVNDEHGNAATTLERT